MLAFVHISKTAGTTLTQILRRSFGVRHCDLRLWPWEQNSPRVASAADVRRVRAIYWRLASIAGHEIVPYSDLRQACPALRFYTIFRDPLVRYASHYQSLVRKRPMADRFHEWWSTGRFWNWHTQKLAGCQDADRAIEILEDQIDFVGLTEQFDEFLVMFRRWVGELEVDIAYDSENVARDNSIKKRLLADPACRTAMEEANQEDLKLYQYVLDKVYPRQIQDYGDELSADVIQFHNRDHSSTFSQPLLGKLVRDWVYKPLLPLTTRGRIPDRDAAPRRRAA